LTRALMLLSLSALIWIGPSFAAQHAPAEHGSEGETSNAAELEPATLWKWVNFAILAGLLGYLISKKSGVYFDTRTRAIRRAMDEAAKLRRDAEMRAAEIQQRLDNLSAEIEQLRNRARQEMEAESERMRQETEEAMKKIQIQAEHSIAAATKSARQELKAYSAQLALEVAEQKIRARLTPETEAGLVRSFLTGLEHRTDGHSEQGLN
jgi:F-type H+-transporting ATPase subunit b